MIIIIQVALYFVIIHKIYARAGIEAALGNHLLAVLIGSTVLIAAAGYIINDYYDSEPDEINKPDKVIVGRHYSHKSALILNIIFNVAAVAGGFYLAIAVDSWRLGFLFPMLIMLLWLYSIKYKRMVIWGNVAVAFLSAMVILVVWLFEFMMLRKTPSDFVALAPYLGIITWYFGLFALFAFLLTVVREVIKDAEDVEGDKLAGINTFAVEYNVRASARLAMIISGFSLVLLVPVIVVLFEDQMTMAGLYYIAAVVVPLAYFIYMAAKAREKKDFRILSYYIKALMLAGVIGLQPISLYLS